MQAHCRSARQIAAWLEQQGWVEKVYYAGLASHAGHVLAGKQQRDYGAVLSFCVRGDRGAAWRFIDATRLFSLTANLGDAKSTIVHPATTTHGRLSPDERKQAGIADNLVRLSIGLEDRDDLLDDLKRGAAAL